MTRKNSPWCSGSPKPRKLKHFSWHKTNGYGLLGQKRCFASGVHESRSNSHIGRVLRDVKTVKEGDSKQTAWCADFRCRVVAGQRIATPHCRAHRAAARELQMGIVGPSAVQSGPRPQRPSLVPPSENFLSISELHRRLGTEISGGRLAEHTGGSRM